MLMLVYVSAVLLAMLSKGLRVTLLSRMGPSNLVHMFETAFALRTLKPCRLRGFCNLFSDPQNAPVRSMYHLREKGADPA